ncbi:hypothetical protein F5Y16DRAFT_398269 [Xylariaceae sp. FL0255]|nr:hypothetical protein F5Y16DRAFT_398269 [Xylariaceae sp. FL0255]
MPEDWVSQALGPWEESQRVEENRADRWMEWLTFKEVSSRDKESKQIEEKCREVAKLWRTFKSQFIELALMDGIANPPSITTLQEAVTAAHLQRQEKKEKGFGKVKENVASFIESPEGPNLPIPQNNRAIGGIHSGGTALEVSLVQTRAEVYEMAQCIIQRSPPRKETQFLNTTQEPEMLDMPEEVVIALRRWTTSPGSCFLWVEGPADNMSKKRMLSMANHIYEGALTSRIPTFWHSLSLNSGNTSELTALIDLHYSMILQLINILPETFDMTSSLKGEKLSLLDGTLGSVGIAQAL